MKNNSSSFVPILESTLKLSREKEYSGYDKADGMSSKILRTLPIDNKWVNLAFQETVKRAPLNIRPALFIEKRRIPKGIALFTLANLNAFEITSDDVYLKEAKKLVDWLIRNQIKGYSGYCLGHSHAVQGLNKKTPSYTPDIVTTSYVVKALLALGTQLSDGKYHKLAYSTSKFVFEDLEYEEIDAGARIKYKPSSSTKSYTLNANALGARLLIDLYPEFSEKRFRKSSKKILDYVVSHQTEAGGWMYTDPPSASHLSMDNYHNGFIIESLLRYQEVTGSNRYEDSIQKSLHFYKNVLYNEDGSPNWDETSEYPKDIHGVAQGIIVFTKAGDLKFARKIIDWTLDNLYAGDGQFYYQKRKFYTKKFTLMRWCQAWMAYAISKYLIQMSY